MPYKSMSKMRFMNANKKKIGPAVVDEFNEASKGMKLPERAGKRITKKKK